MRLSFSATPTRPSWSRTTDHLDVTIDADAAGSSSRWPSRRGGCKADDANVTERTVALKMETIAHVAELQRFGEKHASKIARRRWWRRHNVHQTEDAAAEQQRCEGDSSRAPAANAAADEQSPHGVRDDAA
jgi:hypothetical protein